MRTRGGCHVWHWQWHQWRHWPLIGQWSPFLASDWLMEMTLPGQWPPTHGHHVTGQLRGAWACSLLSVHRSQHAGEYCIPARTYRWSWGKMDWLAWIKIYAQIGAINWLGDWNMNKSISYVSWEASLVREFRRTDMSNASLHWKFVDLTLLFYRCLYSPEPSSDIKSVRRGEWAESWARDVRAAWVRPSPVTRPAQQPRVARGEARRGTAANITHLDTETQSVPSPTLGRTHGPVPGVLTLSSPRPTRGRETFPRDLSDDIMQGDTDISAQADIMIHVVYVWWQWWGDSSDHDQSVLWACESSAGQWALPLAKQLLIWMTRPWSERCCDMSVVNSDRYLIPAAVTLMPRYDCEESIECHNHNIDSPVILRSCQDLTPSSRHFMFT